MMTYRQIHWPNVPSVYVAVETGQIVSLRHPIRVLSHEAHYRSGHLRVSLGRRARVWAHRLVCFAWHGPPPDEEHSLVLHGPNHDPKDNRPSNLRWGSFEENMRDREEHQRMIRELLCPELRVRREQDQAARQLEVEGALFDVYVSDEALGF